MFVAVSITNKVDSTMRYNNESKIMVVSEDGDYGMALNKSRQLIS